MDKGVMDESVQRFWDRYVKSIHDQGIEPLAERWDVIRADPYIRAFPDRCLTEHTPDDVTAYLTRQGRNTALKDWQFAQIIGLYRISLRSSEMRSDSGNHAHPSTRGISVGSGSGGYLRCCFVPRPCLPTRRVRRREPA